VDLGLEPKFLVKAHQRALRIRACYPHPDESPTPTAPSSKCKPSCKGFKPPVVQSLVKWRSEERNPIPRMKFRDIYAYVGTPLKHTSQVVSRCMQVLYMQALQAVQTMGLPTMLGVRDLWLAVQRITNVAGHMHLCERDMDDMYWRIPKAQVIQAQVDTAKWVAKWRRLPSIWFSIHRGGDHSLDRIGKGASSQFWTIPLTFVLKFLRWELTHNVLVCFGRLILKQGDSGVPIGNCISQQASEICCLWCEHGAFDPLFNKDTSTQWKSDLLVRSRGLQVRVPADAAVCLPGLTEFVPLDAHLEPLDGVWASPKRHLAEMPTLMAEGFDGWWEPMQYTVGWFTWDGQDIPIIIPALWDSAPLGRVGKIVHAAPRKDRHRLRTFFEQFDPVAAILPELKFRYSPGAETADSDLADLRTEQQACTHTPAYVHTHTEGQTRTATHCAPQTQITPAFPAIVMARLKDNIYMILCNMQQDLQTGMALALESLLQTIYGIAFKWELHTTQINWCESMLTRYEGRWALFRKGVCLQLPVSAQRIQGDYEWQKWTPVSSPNAADVIKTFLPSLALKSVWHASDLQCVVIN